MTFGEANRRSPKNTAAARMNGTHMQDRLPFITRRAWSWPHPPSTQWETTDMVERVKKNLRRMLLAAGTLAASTLISPNAVKAGDNCQPLDTDDIQCVSCDWGSNGCWFYVCEGQEPSEVFC